MKRYFFTLIFSILCSLTFAQFSISGTVKNQDNEPLVGANVIIENSLNGVSCNTSGEFGFHNLKQGEYKLTASFIGYDSQTINILLKKNETVEFQLKINEKMTDEIIIQATRAGEKTPFAYSDIDNEEINRQNSGQDIPSLLKLTPSLVTSSDAGTGIGYSQFWIRGSDLTRINVTLNGIPMNDAESHSVYWVDIPDFASSVENIQIQRGAGTSTNGAGAFGASVNLQTAKIEKEPYAEISNSYGSFNTLKNTVEVGSGLIKDKFVFDFRLSKINSAGFVDRAWSDLKSYYISGAYVNKNTLIRLNIFSGLEKTYQSWNGVPKVRLENDIAGMQRYLDHWLYSENQYENMINSNSRTYNLYTYENQIDNYKQDYYQLFITQSFLSHFNFNSAFFLTRGLGYYEQFEEYQKLSDYNFENVITTNDTITRSDLIRRKWLDNYFLGTTYSLNYNYKKINAIIGGSWNKYYGNHFGDVIWMQYAGNNQINKEWYRNKGIKTDFNIFGKVNYQLNNWLNIFGDLQYRTVSHDINGIDDDLRDITQFHNFDFFNPKIGMFLDIADNQNIFFSFSIANREPKRSDFTDAIEGQKPLSERLYDYEAGYKFSSNNFRTDINVFYMDYINQLIMTGQINDVGSAIMVNVPNSYRTGVEISTDLKLINLIDWNFNITLSENKIKNFTEYIDNWDNGIQLINDLGDTDISFSPSIVAGNVFTLNLTKNFSVDIVSKYVSRQFIDNTSNIERSLDAYFVNDARINLNFKTDFIEEININLQVNNFLDTEYETFAWVYKYSLGGEFYTMDGYFPQAGINIMGNLNLRF